MSIVLIYPFRRNTDIGAGSPIGLLYLATYLKMNDFETTVIDLAGEEASDAEVIDDIVDKKPAIVGLPLYSVNMKTVYDFVSQLSPGSTVIGKNQAS